MVIDIEACDDSMSTTLELFQDARSFPCDTLSIDESGSQYIECERVVGTMETGVDCESTKRSCTCTDQLGSLRALRSDIGLSRRDSLMIPWENFPVFQVKPLILEGKISS
jgi:hypothetical protein